MLLAAAPAPAAAGERARPGSRVLPARAPARAAAGERARPGCVTWVVSAHDEPALRAQAQRLREHVAARPELEPVDVGLVARDDPRAPAPARGRRRRRPRDAARAPRRGRLRRAVAGRRPRVAPARPGKVAFVFPGQGSQWLGHGARAMGLLGGLRRADGRLRRGAARVRRLGPARRPARRAGRAPLGSHGRRAARARSRCSCRWRRCGARSASSRRRSSATRRARSRPRTSRGALSLEDAARVVALRARAARGGRRRDGVARADAGRGARGAIARIGGLVARRLQRPARRRSSPATPEPSTSCWRRARPPASARGRSRRVPGALRRDRGDPRAPARRSRARRARGRRRADLLDDDGRSSIDGADAGARALVSQPARAGALRAGTRALLADGVTTFVEVSPHPVLTWALRETVEDASAEPGRIGVVGSLRRDEGGLERFLTSVGEAHAGGVRIDWRAVLRRGRPAARRPADLRVPAPALPGRRGARGGAGRGAAPRSPRLAGAERDATLLALVRTEAASLLGRGSAADVRAAARVSRAGLRLAAERRAAHPPRAGHRAAPARHARLRPPDAGRRRGAARRRSWTAASASGARSTPARARATTSRSRSSG